MNSYMGLKHLHMTCVALSASLFVLRFAWRMQGSALSQRKLVKIAPHVIDTCLLLSALGLAVMASINPFEQTWLAAKIIALLLYIFLGTMAIKRSKTQRGQLISFAFACGVFAYIIAVAMTKQVMPWM